MLYLSEQLNSNLYFTLEKLIFFSGHIHIFCPHFLCQSKEKFVKCSHEREEGKLSDSQIFIFCKNSKSSQCILLAFGFLLLFSIVQALQNSKNFSHLFCYLSRARSEYTMIRPRQHGLAVLVSSTPILSLLVFIIAIRFGLEVHMPGTCPKSAEGKS